MTEVGFAVVVVHDADDQLQLDIGSRRLGPGTQEST